MTKKLLQLILMCIIIFSLFLQTAYPFRYIQGRLVLAQTPLIAPTSLPSPGSSQTTEALSPPDAPVETSEASETSPAGSVIINEDANFTASPAVSLTLSITATDNGSGYVFIANDNDFGGTVWLTGSTWLTGSVWLTGSMIAPYSAALPWNLSTGDGLKTVYAIFQDAEGNVSKLYSDTIILDTLAPTGAILIQNGSAVLPSRDIILQISASDANGVTDMRLRNQQSDWEAWETFAPERAWSLPAQSGLHTVSAQYKDAAGNVSPSYTAMVELLLEYKLFLPIVMKNWPKPTPTPTRTSTPTPTATPIYTSTPTPTATPIHTPTPTSVTDDFRSRVIARTNDYRLQNGCSALTMNELLNNAAQGHSNDMALNDFFSHTGSNGSSPWDRMRNAGYYYSRAAENVAAGYSSPESVVVGWMNSAGHRANILNCDLKDIGVGYYYLGNDTGNVNYRHYWTQVFGTSSVPHTLTPTSLPTLSPTLPPTVTPATPVSTPTSSPTTAPTITPTPSTGN